LLRKLRSRFGTCTVMGTNTVPLVSEGSPPVLDVNLVLRNASAHQRLELLEPRRSTLYTKVAVESLEFVVAGAYATQWHRAHVPATVREASGFRRAAKNLAQARARAGHVRQGVFLARVAGDAVFTRSAGSTNSISMFSPMPSRCR